MAIGEKLKQIQTERGWSRRRLAQECGISYEHVGQIVNGDRKNLQLGTIRTLCLGLRVSADELLELPKIS
jgi:transcriptional regulator with XRE-family HTH domain